MSLLLSEARARVRASWPFRLWCWLTHEGLWTYFWTGSTCNEYCPVCKRVRDAFDYG